MRLKETEIEIQAVICEYLFDLKHYFGWRVNNTPVSQIREGKRIFRKMPKWGLKGIADIYLLKEGISYFIEVKSANGVVSEEQKTFGDNCIKHGAKFFIVKSLEEVKEIGL